VCFIWIFLKALKALVVTLEFCQGAGSENQSVAREGTVVRKADMYGLPETRSGKGASNFRVGFPAAVALGTATSFPERKS